jgi:hypothetical protein
LELSGRYGAQLDALHRSGQVIGAGVTVHAAAARTSRSCHRFAGVPRRLVAPRRRRPPRSARVGTGR